MVIPKYRIIAQLFESDRTTFRLQKAGKNECIEKTASDISQDINIISSLSTQDAYIVGYVSASEKLLSDFLLLPRNLKVHSEKFNRRLPKYNF